MSYLLWLLKYILLFVLAFIIYLVYTIVVKVYFVRRKYSKYPNVYLNPTFVPFLGDLLEFIKSVNGGGVYYSHLFEKAQIYSKFDLKVEMEGSVTVIKVISPEAQKCFKDLQPTKIDRYAEWKAFGKIGPQGFFNIRSNTAFNDRKKLFMSLLSFNSVSKYIPNIFECTKRSLKNLKTNDEFDCVPIMNLLTFNVFVQIMFGKDVEQIVILGADYINKEGITERINLCEFLVRLLKDLIDGYLHPFTLALPFINYYSLANPFKRNNKNINTLQKCLMGVINKCNDTDSICFKLINNENFDKTVILQDMIAFLVGGTESTAHTLTSILYFLKKNPEKYDVLMKELSQYGFKRFSESLEPFEKENLHEVNYLNYTIREALRMDAPFFESLSHLAYEDVEICGVPISKGTLLRVDISTPQNNPDEWKNPREFIPERFDPESECYFKPNGDKRNPYSFIPFSHGNRSCPGQMFAILESKVVLAYFLSNFDFEVANQEILSKNNMGFGVGSEIKLNIKITKSLHSS